MFPVDKNKFILWWRLYSNMCAVNSSDYIRETSSCCPPHTAGMAQLSVDWHTPDRLASSLWKAPVARNPRVVSTCVGTDNPLLLAVFRSRAGHSSVHSSSNTGLGNLKWLMSQLSWFANRSSHSLNTLSRLILPFVMSSKEARAAIVNGIFSSICACFYIHPYDGPFMCVSTLLWGLIVFT